MSHCEDHTDMTSHDSIVRAARWGPSLGLTAALLLPMSAQCQITPAQASQIKSVISDRIEALTVFGGDYLLGGGTFQSTENQNHHLDLAVSKFGGSGEFADLEQLGDLPVAWRPRLMGNIGFIEAKNQFTSGVFAGDLNKTKTSAIQFGGGARFWFTDDFSIAPTVTGMYGHTTNEYTAKSALMLANLSTAKEAGLIDWSADTWSIEPSVNLEYLYTWDRTIITLSSDLTYVHTQSFKSSSANVNVNGDSEVWGNTLDIDIPLGRLVFGHELRTGGYLARTELYGNIRDGLNTGYLNEVHGRLVLDFLNELKLTQWLGLGGSYYWGGNFTGWSAGIDFLMVF
jgi:hypothetical protein